MNINEKYSFTEELDRVNMTFSAVAYAELDSEWTFEKMIAPYTRIYLIEKGEARIICEGEIIRLSEGNVYILPAGTDFSCSCDTFMSKAYFHINVLRHNNYDILDGHKKCIVLNNKKEVIARVIQALKKDDVNSALFIKSQIFSLLTEAIEKEKIQLGKIENYSKNVKDALKMIEKNLSASLKISQIAEKLYISESRLQKDFKKETGVSIGKYIDDRLMFRAQEMVGKRGLSIKEISDALGFCDQFYFSRRFTKHFGISPSDYKKSKYLQAQA